MVSGASAADGDGCLLTPKAGRKCSCAIDFGLAAMAGFPGNAQGAGLTALDGRAACIT